MRQTKLSRSLALVLTVLIAATALIISGCGTASTNPGEKTITVIITADGDPVTKTITTEAEFLRGALEEENLIAGEEGQFGLFLKTVNGVTVDENKQQWWCLTKGGADLFTGVDSTVIADGDTFEITLTTGY